MTITVRTPFRDAANASDCPWFPRVALTMPRGSGPAASDASRLSPPRTLNAPVGV